MRYERDRIFELVDLLHHEEIICVYEGMIGLNSFGDTIVSREREEEFFGSGIVPKLARLAQMKKHPYLQFISLKLLKHLALVINQDNFKAFFNLETVPFNFFISYLFL